MMQPVIISSVRSIALLYLVVMCTSCQKSEAEKLKVDRPPASPVSSAVVLPTLDRASLVEIRNDWNGYSDITPILRHYRLKLEGMQLVGTAHIAVGGYGAAGVRQQSTKRVTIPTPVSQNFLATLTRTPLASGTYKPIVVRQDDYPSLAIKITIDRQVVIFSSTSQAAGYRPWQVKISRNGQTKAYISNSDTPDRALKLLAPYVDREGIQNIIQRRRTKIK